MGVHGLTTYLRENQRVLGEIKHFQTQEDDVRTIVVDGLSFIYQVYHQSRLPWAYGGEYKAFANCIVQVVKAWIAVGLKVYFVFDGARPDLKFPTLVSRLTRSNVHNSVLFFRTSPTSRSSPRFLHENHIIPPLVFLSCVETLEGLAKDNPELEVHFADEEGDPFAVELAGRLGAYVAGNDSDFVIFNSGRYAGYIPLEDMLWTAPLPLNDSLESHQEKMDGFQTVTKRPSPAAQQSSSGLIPPKDIPLSDLVLSVVVYTPLALATHLKLPTTLLPLLASLVGNDFTNTSTTQRNVQSLFFERGLTLSRRITRTANTLASILNAATQKRKAKYRVGSVMDLIDRTVNALLVRSPSSLSTGEIDSIVDRVVNAALQYAIDKYEGDAYGPASLWPTPVCALHAADTCPLLFLFSRALSQSQAPGNLDGVSPEPREDRLALRSLCLQAFRAGSLQPQVIDVLSTGTYWPRIYMENPDVENVAISIGRPIRSWIYALLDDGIGLPEAPQQEPRVVDGSESDPDEVGEDPNELIDVVEEDSDDDADLLAPLRGELRRLRGTQMSLETTSAASHSRSRPPPRPKCVSEYIRRGARIAAEEVPVPNLTTLMMSSAFEETIDAGAWVPVQLRSLEDRMALFLHILGSNVPAVKNVSSDRLMAVLVLRWIVRTLHRRALESGMNTEQEQERWTRREGLALLAFYDSPHSIDGTASQANGLVTIQPTTMPLTDRNIQLVAQVLAAIEAIHLLSQVLFLTGQVPANIQTLSGEKFHAHLTNTKPVSEENLPPGLWTSCTADLEDAFAPERQKRRKKKRVEQVNAGAKANNKATMRLGQGLFSLLVDDAA